MSMYQYGTQVEHIVLNHKQKEKMRMKRNIFILGILLLLFSCTSTQNVTQSRTSDNKTQTSTYTQVTEEYAITTEIFDNLQRPLGFALSSQCKPITRQNWEYHMSGIGWWDIYLMTGRKLGNGIYEKSVEVRQNCQIVELHSTRTQYDNSILSVELIFVSSDKSALEKIKSDFVTIATQFTGRQARDENDGIKSWDAGWIHYTSYPIQYHENGNWIYLVSSFDSAHSPY